MQLMILFLLTSLLSACGNRQPVAELEAPNVEEVHTNIAGIPNRRTVELIEKDVGYLALDSNRLFDVEIHNQTDRDWILQDVVTSCGCLLAEKPPPRIAANSSTVVQLTLKAGRKSGDFTRCLRLSYSNSGSTHYLGGWLGSWV